MSEINIGASFTRRRAFLIVLCGCLFAISSFVVKPLYITLLTDIVWGDTILIGFFELVLNLLDIFAYSSAFAVIIYSTFFNTESSPTLGRLIAIYMSLAFLRRLADIIMTIVIYGSVNMSDIWSVLFALAMEFIQIMVVLLISKKVYAKPHDTILPIKKIYSKKNSLQISALFAGGVLSAVKIISRIIYDVFYGLPESLLEVFSMVLFYSADILVALISYTAIIVIMSKLHGVMVMPRD